MCKFTLEYCRCCKEIIQSEDKMFHCGNWEDCDYKRFYYTECSLSPCEDCEYKKCVENKFCSDKIMPSCLDVQYTITKQTPYYH